MNIPDDVKASAKVRKLATAVCTLKEKVDNVTFDLQMQIAKLQLNLQPITLSEVQEQRGMVIKESMAELDVAIQGSDQIFIHAMGIWDTLQEDPMLQYLNKEIRETKQ